jgi:putative SOS response-associated peptidase YedK
MCGRYTIKAPVAQLATLFDVLEPSPLAPRYNVAPTQSVPVVRLSPQHNRREMAMLRWGLIPSWAKDAVIGNRMINARADSEKPSFRSAFEKRRCLVVADGFYEWQKLNGKKQPYYIGLKGGGPFAFAGLWEHWQDPEDKPVETCTIITTDANELVKPIHNRMPVILQPKDYQEWLDPEVENKGELQELLRPYPSEAMTAYPVSSFVNNPNNEDPRCVCRQEAG